jgi:hypothetical protein
MRGSGLSGYDIFSGGNELNRERKSKACGLVTARRSGVHYGFAIKASRLR